MAPFTLHIIYFTLNNLLIYFQELLLDCEPKAPHSLLSPEGLASGWIAWVPVIFVLFKQDRGQLCCKLVYLILAQLALLLHQLCDEENRSSNFIFHLELQHTRGSSCWGREGTSHQRDLITLRHWQIPRTDAAKPARARMSKPECQTAD